MRHSITLALLTLTLALACDETDHDQLRASESSTGTDGSASSGPSEPAPSCSVDACCACVDADLVCLASSEVGCLGTADLLGTAAIELPCQVLDGGAIDCPSIDCSPPVVACCSCSAGEQACVMAPPEGCSSGSKPVAGCEIDVLGHVTCDAFAC